MAQLQLMIGGRWAPAVGPWGGLRFSTCLQGSDTATWDMDQTYRRLQSRQSVRIFDGPTPIWFGILSRPAVGDTQYTAQGLWKEAYHFPAIDTGGFATPVVDDAIDGAISRGLPWTRRVSFNLGSPTAVSASLQGEIPMLGDLLDKWADRHNVYWYVNGYGEPDYYSRPTVPDLVVIPDQPINTADDDYATTLWGIRKDNTGAKVLVGPVTDADAATRWVTPREEVIDLTDFGNVNAPVATDMLTGALTKRHARLGVTATMTVTQDRIADKSGIQAYLPAVRAGMLARALVQYDDSRELNGRTHRDFLIARTDYSTTDPAMVIEPEQLAPRGYKGVLRRIKRQQPRPRAVRL